MHLDQPGNALLKTPVHLLHLIQIRNHAMQCLACGGGEFPQVHKLVTVVVAVKK
jgi:hypothetical protein